MELLTGKTNKVHLEGEAGWSPTATLIKPDNTEVVLVVSDYADGIYEATLPYMVEEGEVVVRWEFSVSGETFTVNHTYSLVTPLLTLREMKKLQPLLDEQALLNLESGVRHIINNTTGQTFGKSTKTVDVRGRGQRASIPLPQRLISFTGIETNQYVYNPYAYEIISDGFYLRQVSASLQTIKQMPSEDSLDYGAVITTPFTSYYKGFRDGATYRIHGTWGYESIPEAVKQAAMLLVDDYGCHEVSYRDKYLESIKAADWRLQFGSAAWDYTGNVRADHLLAPYILLDWAIV